jgi:hypothetical protein
MNRDLLFDIANLGPEINRYFNFRAQKNEVASKASYKISNDLLEKIITNPELSSSGQTEFLMIKEIINHPDQHDDSIGEDLETYFLPFILKLNQ